MAINNYRGTSATIQGMKAAGRTDAEIVDRLVKMDSLDPAAKEIFKKAKAQKLESKAVTDFLALPIGKETLSPVTAEDVRGSLKRTLGETVGGSIANVSEFLGIDKIGRAIGSSLSTVGDKNIQSLREQGEVTDEDLSRFRKGGSTTGELIGSAALTVGNIAAPGIFGATSRALGAVKGGAAVGAGFGALGGLESGHESFGELTRDAITGALIGGAIPLAGRALSSVTKGVGGVPEKLYAQIFKRTKDDLAKNFTTEALNDMQKTRPEQFAQLVKQGIIRVSKEGIQVDKTLAQEALERGLKGSGENMAKIAYTKQLEAEQAVKAAVKGQKVAISDKKEYVKLLKEVSSFFKGSFFGDRSKEAASLAKRLNAVKGNKVPADLALDTRRFLDAMRNTSSFKTNPTLSRQQESLKVASNQLRGELAKGLKGFGDIMDDYRFYIEAFESLVDDAVRRDNRKLLTLTDLLVGGGGLVAGNPIGGLTLGASLRGFQSPTVLTNLAQGIDAVSRGTGRVLSSQGAKTAGSTASSVGKRFLTGVEAGAPGALFGGR